MGWKEEVRKSQRPAAGPARSCHLPGSTGRDCLALPWPAQGLTSEFLQRNKGNKYTCGGGGCDCAWALKRKQPWLGVLLQTPRNCALHPHQVWWSG